MRLRPSLRTRWLVLIAVAACLLLTIGRGTAQIVGYYSCINTPLVINVAVSTDITPAIDQIAEVFNHQEHRVNGRCIAVQVSSDSSATVAAQIDGQHPGVTGGTINAWIPDSSMWVDVVRGFAVGAQTVSPAGFSVAKSPVMIAMPATAAARTPAFAEDGWNLLLPPSAGGPKAAAGLRIDLPDPVQSAVGMATLVEESRLLGHSQAARVKFATFAYSVTVTSYFDDPASLAAFVSQAAPPYNGDPVTVTTEQAVTAYDAVNPRHPLAAIYPSARESALGTPELDYPYVLLATSNAAQLTAAQDFGQILRSRYAGSVVRFAGFRSPDRSAGIPAQLTSSYGLDSQLLQVAPPASALEAPTVLQAWNKLVLGSKDLTLIDVSANMNRPLFPGSPSYEEETRQATILGLPLFPDTTNLGLWEFADHMTRQLPYKVVVPVGPLPGQMGLLTRRQQLERINGNLQATSISSSALYNTMLDGYKYMTRTYSPKFVNIEIVLSAGIDNAPGDISAPELLKKIAKLYNPTRQVSIVMVFFGKPPNLPILQQIGALTGGHAYTISSPSDVLQVFYEATANRLCAPNCATPTGGTASARNR
jgi:Ca-activated chloride channel family protein